MRAIHNLDRRRRICRELRAAILGFRHAVVDGESIQLEQLEQLVRDGELALGHFEAGKPGSKLDDPVQLDQGLDDPARLGEELDDPARLDHEIEMLELALEDPRWELVEVVHQSLERNRPYELEQKALDEKALDELCAEVARYRTLFEEARRRLVALRGFEEQRLTLDDLERQARSALDGDPGVFDARLEALRDQGIPAKIVHLTKEIASARDHHRLAELMLIRSSEDPPEYLAILRTPGLDDVHGLNLRDTSKLKRWIWQRLRDRARELDGHVEGWHRAESRELVPADAPAVPPPLDFARRAQELGDEMYRLIVPHNIRSYLEQVPCSVTITTNDVDLPWELLHLGEDQPFLSLQRPIARMPLDAGSRAPRSPQRRRESHRLKFLLIGANWRRDLPNVPREIERIADALTGQFGDRIQIDAPAATPDALYDAIKDGTYDVLHYAGHAAFDAGNPANSRLLLDDDKDLPASIIERMLRHHPVVFLNACSTAVSGLAAPAGSTAAGGRAAPASIAPAEGLSSAFIYGGALGCIGNLWPVHDREAAEFAVEFYLGLIEGHTLGKAMLLARQKLQGRDANRSTWAGFVLFGNPLFRLRWTDG